MAAHSSTYYNSSNPAGGVSLGVASETKTQEESQHMATSEQVDPGLDDSSCSSAGEFPSDATLRCESRMLTCRVGGTCDLSEMLLQG